MATRKEKLSVKIQQLEAQLKNLDKQERQNHRKTETKKKILLGALLQQWIKMGRIPETEVIQGLDKLLTRASERSLFGLEPLPSSDVSNHLQETNNTQLSPQDLNEPPLIPSPPLPETADAAIKIMTASTQDVARKSAARLPEVDERKLEEEFL